MGCTSSVRNGQNGHAVRTNRPRERGSKLNGVQEVPRSNRGTPTTHPSTNLHSRLRWLGVRGSRPRLAAHVTPVGTRAIDEDGHSYHVVAAETYADPVDRFVRTLRFIIAGGEITDSVNIVISFDPAPHQFYVDFGTCGF
jgi:hypothetical protein